MKRYPMFSVQMINYQIAQMHKSNILLVKFISKASQMEFSYFLHMV